MHMHARAWATDSNDAHDAHDHPPVIPIHTYLSRFGGNAQHHAHEVSWLATMTGESKTPMIISSSAGPLPLHQFLELSNSKIISAGADCDTRATRDFCSRYGS